MHIKGFISMIREFVSFVMSILRPITTNVEPIFEKDLPIYTDAQPISGKHKGVSQCEPDIKPSEPELAKHSAPECPSEPEEPINDSLKQDFLKPIVSFQKSLMLMKSHAQSDDEVTRYPQSDILIPKDYVPIWATRMVQKIVTSAPHDAYSVCRCYVVAWPELTASGNIKWTTSVYDESFLLDAGALNKPCYSLWVKEKKRLLQRHPPVARYNTYKEALERVIRDYCRDCNEPLTKALNALFLEGKKETQEALEEKKRKIAQAEQDQIEKNRKRQQQIEAIREAAKNRRKENAKAAKEAAKNELKEKDRNNYEVWCNNLKKARAAKAKKQRAKKTNHLQDLAITSRSVKSKSWNW